MSMVLANTEFFTFEDEVWIREQDASMKILRETDYDFISAMVDHIARFYPKAYEALKNEYIGCAQNQSYFRFRIVCRFIRCNFAVLDNMPDVGADLKFSFEHINCPLRGECRYDRVICRPEFDHQLSPSERRVLSLIYEGLTEGEVADRLRLSEFTIHTHVRNAYHRLGLHSKSEFVKYATQHNLFT